MLEPIAILYSGNWIVWENAKANSRYPLKVYTLMEYVKISMILFWELFTII